MKQKMDAKDGLYQHYNTLFIAGTRDFPQAHIDDSKSPFDYTLNKTHRAKTADAYYRSHHEIDTVIGHSLGGSVALALRKECKKQNDNQYGLIQSTLSGVPVISCNCSGT